jgi:hypothetical protein
VESLLHSKFETYLFDDEQYTDKDTTMPYEKEFNMIENFPEGFFSEL